MHNCITLDKKLWIAVEEGIYRIIRNQILTSIWSLFLAKINSPPSKSSFKYTMELQCINKKIRYSDTGNIRTFTTKHKILFNIRICLKSGYLLIGFNDSNRQFTTEALPVQSLRPF